MKNPRMFYIHKHSWMILAVISFYNAEIAGKQVT